MWGETHISSNVPRSPTQPHLMWGSPYNMHIILWCVIYVWLKDNRSKWQDKNSLIFECHFNGETLTWNQKQMGSGHFLIMCNISTCFQGLKTPKGSFRGLPIKNQTRFNVTLFHSKRLKLENVKENCDHRFHSRLLSWHLNFRALYICIWNLFRNKE